MRQNAQQLLVIVALLVAAVIGFYFFRNTVTAGRFNCSIFKTQAEAQRYFDRTHDRRLDRDNDSEACEQLP